MIRFRPATKTDVLRVGDLLRPEDWREVRAQAGVERVPDYLQAAWQSVPQMYVADSPDSGWPMCLIGVREEAHPLLGPGARVFLLGTEEIENYPVGIYRESVEWRDRWLDRWPVLWNTVDMRNEMHVRWIQAAGFTLGGVWYINGHRFRIFSIEDN